MEEIRNQKTGQTIRFFSDQGDATSQVLKMEASYPPGSKEPPIHYHPYQQERFEVLSGELTIRLNGEIKRYQKGSVIHIEKGAKHSMWNSGRENTLVNWQVTPALESGQFLRAITEAANGPGASDKGIPGPAEMIYLLNRYRNVIRLVKPSYPLTRIVGILLLPLLRFKTRLSI